MNKFILLCSIFALLAARLHGAELAWNGLYGYSLNERVHISSVAQLDSEVYFTIPIFAIADSCDLPSHHVPIDFPTLFVTKWAHQYEREPDNLIYTSSDPQPQAEYDYELGNGWIFHLKSIECSADAPVGLNFVPSLGWIYIRAYPWVYGEDWGWRYVVESEIVWYANSWWFYEPDYGWFWTNRDTYPWIYHEAEGWVIYPPSSTAEE